MSLAGIHSGVFLDSDQNRAGRLNLQMRDGKIFLFFMTTDFHTDKGALNRVVHSRDMEAQIGSKSS